MQDLLSVNDPDWAGFNNADPDYLLRVCGATIRKYCGWHIYPRVTETAEQLRIGTGGRIMLPSLHVTDVSAVSIRTGEDTWVDLDPTQYEWFEEGYVLPYGYQGWGSYTGYYYGPDAPVMLPWMNYGWADVTFTHGYDAVPEDVKQVAFEMASASGASGGAKLPSNANVKEVASPGFRLMLGGNTNELGGTGTAGSLTQSQKNRLASYRIGWTA